MTDLNYTIWILNTYIIPNIDKKYHNKIKKLIKIYKDIDKINLKLDKYGLYDSLKKTVELYKIDLDSLHSKIDYSAIPLDWQMYICEIRSVKRKFLRAECNKEFESRANLFDTGLFRLLVKDDESYFVGDIKEINNISKRLTKQEVPHKIYNDPYRGDKECRKYVELSRNDKLTIDDRVVAMGVFKDHFPHMYNV